MKSRVIHECTCHDWQSGHEIIQLQHAQFNLVMSRRLVLISSPVVEVVAHSKTKYLSAPLDVSASQEMDVNSSKNRKS